MQYSKAWLFNVPTWDIFKVLSRLEHEPKQHVPISRKSSWNWTLGKLEQLANIYVLRLVTRGGMINISSQEEQNRNADEPIDVIESVKVTFLRLMQLHWLRYRAQRFIKDKSIKACAIHECAYSHCC